MTTQASDTYVKRYASSLRPGDIVSPDRKTLVMFVGMKTTGRMLIHVYVVHNCKMTVLYLFNDTHFYVPNP